MMAMSRTDKAAMKKQEAEWRAETDLNTLIEAAKINKDPARKKAAMAKRKAMMAELEKIEAKPA